MARLLFLAAALSLTGCLFDDCSFDIDETQYDGRVQAEVSAVGDTLTVAFVDAFDPSVQAFLPAGIEPVRDSGTSHVVQIGFQAESRVFADRDPIRLDAVAVGDTVYVYVPGSVDPSLFSQACSPPEESIRLTVGYIAAPEPVRVLRTVRLGPEDVSLVAAEAIRQRESARLISALALSGEVCRRPGATRSDAVVTCPPPAGRYLRHSPRPPSMARLSLLLATLILGGCVFGDCEFSAPDNVVRGSATIEIDAAAVGNTLTVAFVQALAADLQGYVADGFESNPTPTSDRTVRLAFDQESARFGDGDPYRLDAVAVGDTVYVYIEGTVDPLIFSQACSPSEPAGVSVGVESVSAPASVREIRTTHLSVGDLPTGVADALRQRAAHRPISV